MIGSLAAGMFFGAKASNIITDPKDLYPDRRLNMKDAIANMDDVVGGLILAKFPLIDKLHIEKMPDTHFLIQEEVSAFDELVKASALPSFTSDLVIQREGEVPNRVKVPILDEEANVTYFLYFHKKDAKLFDRMLQQISVRKRR